MNILKVNNQLVWSEYAMFDNGGSILILLVEASTGTPNLHELICTSLRKRFQPHIGIQESQDLEKRSPVFPDRSFSEIRLLEFSVLEVIDHLRSVGFSVVEVAPG